MNTIGIPEAINHDRRRLLATAAMTIVAASALSLVPGQLAAAADGNAIRPFHVNVPERDLVDLRRRVLATRWPARETVADQSQGVQLAKLKELIPTGGRTTTGARWKRS